MQITTSTKEYTDCRTTEGEAVTLIDTISVLLKQLYRYKPEFKKQSVKNAIKDLQHSEQEYFILSKLAFTEEDVENRKVISNLVQKIKEEKIKIEI